ncbi:MAG TPA: glycosyltransferase, partial [Candidatus Baltobacteraceae bacterium]|nr:glycosyltransferase [Candidatus Baltobacteraceae bacterium]
ALDDVPAPLCAVAIVGRSARSEARVVEHARRVRYPVRVLRFVDNVYDYMHAADVLISKPGGLTTSEALAANLPLVLYKPLPGQEERNTRYLIQRGAAERAKTEEDLALKTGRLLREGDRLSKMRASMSGLAKPNAAEDIARIILDVSAKAKGEAVR